MAANDPLVLVSAVQRVDADSMPAMVREQAIAETGMWAGLVGTETDRTRRQVRRKL